MKRNAFLYCFRFFVTMFMGVVTATTFLRTELSANSIGSANLYFGVIFFSLIMVLFDGFAEETLTVRFTAHKAHDAQNHSIGLRADTTQAHCTYAAHVQQTNAGGLPGKFLKI